MDYRELMRIKLLEDVYNKMSDEEKRAYIQLTTQDKNRGEILRALQEQGVKIDEVSRKIGKHPFATDLLSNVLGNGITDGLIWLGRSLFRKL